MAKIDTSFFNHPLITETGFFPRTDAPASVFSVPVGDVTLACWYEVRIPGAKTVIFFHGNGETAADYVDLFPDIFEQLGFNLLLAEYREYGASTGTAALESMLPDGEAIMKAASLQEEQVVVFGRSLGGIYAVELARRCPDIAGLILESGVSSPRDFVLKRAQPGELGVTQDEFDQAIEACLDSARKMATYQNPLLILHAEHDTLVPVNNAHNFYNWAAGKNKKIVTFPRGGHNDILSRNWDDYWGSVAEFLLSL
jgi:pimeloyl-ACP methyl ester carboxylesterase